MGNVLKTHLGRVKRSEARTEEFDFGLRYYHFEKWHHVRVSDLLGKGDCFSEVSCAPRQAVLLLGCTVQADLQGYVFSRAEIIDQ